MTLPCESETTEGDGEDDDDEVEDEADNGKNEAPLQ